MICGQKTSRDCQFGEFALKLCLPSTLSLSYIGTSLRMVSHLQKECNNRTWTKVVQPTKGDILRKLADSGAFEGQTEAVNKIQAANAKEGRDIKMSSAGARPGLDAA